jgi:maltose O-acetyltransferase
VAPADISGTLALLEVGAESFIGRVTMQVTAPLRIGSRVCINDGAKLLTATHDVQDGSWPTVSRPIVVGDYAWIATDATILSGVTIGRGAVVGASAVVARDVPDFAVAVGNPARIMADHRAPALNYSPTRLLAVVGAWLGNYESPSPH